MLLDDGTKNTKARTIPGSSIFYIWLFNLYIYCSGFGIILGQVTGGLREQGSDEERPAAARYGPPDRLSYPRPEGRGFYLASRCEAGC